MELSYRSNGLERLQDEIEQKIEKTYRSSSGKILIIADHTRPVHLAHPDSRDLM